MDHAAPTSPGSGRRQRAGSRSFSIGSNKSGGKEPHTPSASDRADKERRDSFMRGESKANPNAAVQELQPQARNVLEKVTLDSIRSVQAKDAQGNVIAEPDLCNPTRSRWERPLDTIRAFERAIDGDYHRRTVSRGPSEFDRPDNYASRRSSYYGGHNGATSGRPSANGYYGGRSESYNDSYAAPPRARFSRGMSEGGIGRHSNGYGPPSQYGSQYGGYGYNNNNSQEGSDGTGPWANSTDPSSQNSSFERLNGAGKHGQSPEHGYNMHDPYASQPINEEIDDYGFPPRPPQKGANYGSPTKDPARQPIKLGGSGTGMLENQGGQLPSTTRQPAVAEKRQSWLGRRFSKSK